MSECVPDFDFIFYYRLLLKNLNSKILYHTFSSILYTLNQTSNNYSYIFSLFLNIFWEDTNQFK